MVTRASQKLPMTYIGAVKLHHWLQGARYLSLSLALACFGAHADQTLPPRATAQDLVAELRLPPLKDKTSDALAISLKQLQVLQRARVLRVTGQTALAAWRKGEETLFKATMRTADEDPAFAAFEGSKSSDLNRFLRTSRATAVKVSSPQLAVDEPLQLTGPLQLDLGTTVLRAAGLFPYLIRIEQAHDVAIRGGILRESELAQAVWGVLVADSTSVLLRGMRIQSLAGGIVMTNVGDSVLWENELHSITHAPILLHGTSERNVIARNNISGNEGFSNWEAAIVISDRNYRDFARAPAAFLNARGFPGEQLIVQRLKIPRDNVISSNRLSTNKSSGLYIDGAIGNLVSQNSIEMNAK